MSEDSSGSVPVPVRLAIALLSLVVGMGLWFPLIRRAPSAIDGLSLAGAFVAMFAALAVLGILRTRHRPFAPIRASLGLVVISSLLMILSLPVPPRASSVGSMVAGVLAIVLAVAASLLLADRPKVARTLLILLAGLGSVYVYGIVIFAMSPIYGASVKESSFVVVVAAMACFAATWHARGLWRSPTSRHHAPAR